MHARLEDRPSVDCQFGDSNRDQSQGSFGEQDEANCLEGIHQQWVAGWSWRCIDLDQPVLRLPMHASCSRATTIVLVSEAQAAVIRTAFEQRGEPSQQHAIANAAGRHGKAEEASSRINILTR